MDSEPPRQTPERKPSLPSLIRWLAWGFPILLGASVVMMLVGIGLSVAKDGWHSRKLPFLLFMVVFVVGFFCLKALTNPIRGRGDERRAWKVRFPLHTHLEIDRFLRVVADSQLTSEKHLCRLRPDDRVAALTQEWLCGDGMDIIELFMAIEREYGLDLPESLHEPDRTLGDQFAHVTHRSPRRQPPAASGTSDKAVSA